MPTTSVSVDGNNANDVYEPMSDRRDVADTDQIDYTFSNIPGSRRCLRVTNVNGLGEIALRISLDSAVVPTDITDGDTTEDNCHVIPAIAGAAQEFPLPGLKDHVRVKLTASATTNVHIALLAAMGPTY